ncbi:phage major capsid protein [Clostridium beijerinckii]|uniref:Phage major capsid protein n=1 Tax=Clostridium beijerinckii TaxID=1520 RepID=A0AAW3WDS9_CLOBE|nr:phage major capsid protein [Clostridium beijerinckii]MBC2459396.1 phage major capsid protein [Clostridium beijerinckii]MBC2476908.1 phage major capsid protein [Clostridium beijerinckii]NOV62730.1 HK97 family phage major capsid protein [Clostridium beijerinckii]NOV70308.1 HK97 family phage major capsid protein [Clostridium beijerinckii]NOW30784.1 HK97 family phage major capsid protein [Clostridium beijerinckii]
MKKKILELRAVENLKGMTEELLETKLKINKMVDELEKDEKRAYFNDEEKKEYNSLVERAEDLQQEILKIEDEREKKINFNNAEFRAIENVILPNEKIEKRSYSDNSNPNMDFGKLVKGMAGKGWNGAKKEQEHYRAMQSAENSVIIPQVLADRIIDVARTKSALFGKTPVIQMDNNNLSIAVQTKDAVANFVNEGELIPTGEALFEKVDLKGKTLAIFIPVSEELLDSASNLSNQLLNSSAMAIGLALDKAMLYGKGVVEGSPTEIKGISEYATINKVSHTGATLDYDLLIKGLKSCKSSNIEPNNIVYSTDMGMDLAMLKDSQGQYITKPSALNNYTISESNNVNANESYIYDSNSLLLGLHKGVTIEWGVSGDMFQRIQKGLRIYLRADLGVINPKGITQATFTKMA